jgi:branched-subunit amino acid aminotransferase/4-amino-4-deoxychorismate lyase
MAEPIAYLNGQFVPVSQAALSVFDLGVVAGAAVTEMVRTFRHIPFRLNQHLDRFYHSLDLLQFDPRLNRSELESICLRVIRENARLIPAEHDLGLVFFVTMGKNLTYLGGMGAEMAKTPSVCVHTFPLPFELWAEKYQTGVHLVATSGKCLPDDVLDSRIKHRNRLHWYVADQQAKQIDPAAMAVLTDNEGCLTETGTGNLCVVEGETILTPERNVLRGVSRDVVGELAASLGMTLGFTRITSDDLMQSKEAFITSTPLCLLPVTKFNQQPIRDGKPGPVFQRLMNAWNEMVGLDIIEQMQTGARSRTS